ncbi:MAG TPA: TIR domain-containing protein, partial [Ktedonobacteraceae bacterium]|nr:TIR domain-containing protein [Ktedonobacteraceae bacterium]
MAAKIFYCYAHEDKPLRDELGRHLGPLRNQGWITEWHDQEIQPGTDWKQEINVHLSTADIVLLLISADFMDSDYCYGVEMQRALERHRTGEAQVLPIILRPTDWEETPIGELQALPTGGKAVVLWPVRDEAYRDVVRGIRGVVRVLLRAEKERARQAEQASVASPVSHPAASAFRHLTATVTHTTRTCLRLLLAKPLALAVTLTVLLSASAGIGFFVVPRLSSHPAGSTPTRLTYRGHTASVNTVAWSPDGSRIASGSDDQTVQV